MHNIIKKYKSLTINIQLNNQKGSILKVNCLIYVGQQYPNMYDI